MNYCNLLQCTLHEQVSDVISQKKNFCNLNETFMKTTKQVMEAPDGKTESGCSLKFWIFFKIGNKNHLFADSKNPLVWKFEDAYYSWCIICC
jgi:hypothetical protein